MVKAEFPTSLDVDFKFLDRYSLQDLARIGVPAAAGWSAAGLPGVGAGVMAGLGLAEFTLRGKPVDKYLADYVKYRFVGGSDHSPVKTVLDDAVVLKNGVVLGMVDISSCDLEMLQQFEKQANQDVVHDLFTSIDFPVTIHSRQQETDLSHHIGVDSHAVTTSHTVIVKAKPNQSSVLPRNGSNSENSLEDRVSLVQDRCTRVRNLATGADLLAEKVTGNTTLRNRVEKLDFDKSHVSPGRYTVKPSAKPVHRLVYLTDFPQQLRTGWLAKVLNTDTPGRVDTIQYVEPVSEDQRTRLSRLVGRITAELPVTRDPWRRKQLEQAKEDAENMIQAESIGEETLVNYGVYIIARGHTHEEADDTLKAVRSTLRRHRIEFSEPYLQTHKAVKTESPFYPDPLSNHRIIPGTAAASGFPFAAYDTIETGGIAFGEDTRNDQPVILNRFSWDAPHIVRMGKSGAGKSYKSFLEIIRSFYEYEDLQVRIVDPKPEYGRLIKALDGQTVNLDRDHPPIPRIDADAARFTVKDQDTIDRSIWADTVQRLYKWSRANKDEPGIILVDEAHRLLKDEDGADVLSTLIRESRDTQTGVTLVTQSYTDFDRTESGRDILRNADCFEFFKHNKLTDGMQSLFNLSDREKAELTGLSTGSDLPFSEAVLRGPANTKIRVKGTPEEHRLITAEQ